MVDSPIKKLKSSPRLEHSIMGSSIQSVPSNGGLSFITELKRLQNLEEAKISANPSARGEGNSVKKSARLGVSPMAEPHEAYNNQSVPNKSKHPVVPKLDLKLLHQRVITEVKVSSGK
jgi:hypothetical protein